MKRVVIETNFNPYRDRSEGRVNQPPTVVALLQRAADRLGAGFRVPGKRDVFDRLMMNAPRVAIVSGSADHMAHIMDEQTVYRTALAIWRRGGVPFSFGIPVMCDTTALAHSGMSYSLFSRNLCAEMIANQMEAHNYHAAIVLQGCDKSPLGSACGLAGLDRVRRRRGEAPVWASFVPVHVLPGAPIPPETEPALHALVDRAQSASLNDEANELLAAMSCVIQCATTSTYSSVFRRLCAAGLMREREYNELIGQIASCACDVTGGMCAFNGTGNSSRVVTAALGLAHPATAFLSKPPSRERVNRVVGDLFAMFNRPRFSVLSMVRGNWENAVRLHSATGGSSNLVLHLVALANYAGMKATVNTYDKVRRAVPVPDIFDYSLSEFRSHYELARQCESGRIRGIETIYHELLRHKIPLNLGEPTSTGQTWKERLSDTRGLAASGVRTNQIILSEARRPLSGVDVLAGNFFDSAVVKISGMSDEQLEEFDDKLLAVYYLENEDDANATLLDPNVVDVIYKRIRLGKKTLLTILRHNAPQESATGQLGDLSRKELYDAMVRSGALKVAVVISAQGPKAFGMPEMYMPMHHINCNRRLRKVAAVVSDGRYSGVSYGAAIGHLTPEAADEGDILYLKHGDVLRLRLGARRLDLIDAAALAEGKVKLPKGALSTSRKVIGARRMKQIARRRERIAPFCMQDVSDASTGAIPARLLSQHEDEGNPC